MGAIKLMILAFFYTTIHPFHISVTDIEFDEEAKSIEISQKIFIDDFEELLNKGGNSKVNLLSEEQKERNNQLIKVYLEQNFIIMLNGKAVSYDFLGTNVEGDAIWCFMEIPKTKKLKSIQIKNTVLLQLYEDQMNLVHVKNAGKIKSMRLHKGNLKETFNYE